jgi:hypothetical protein
MYQVSVIPSEKYITGKKEFRWHIRLARGECTILFSKQSYIVLNSWWCSKMEKNSNVRNLSFSLGNSNREGTQENRILKQKQYANTSSQSNHYHCSSVLRSSSSEREKQSSWPNNNADCKEVIDFF